MIWVVLPPLLIAAFVHRKRLADARAERLRAVGNRVAVVVRVATDTRLGSYEGDKLNVPKPMPLLKLDTAIDFGDARLEPTAKLHIRNVPSARSALNGHEFDYFVPAGTVLTVLCEPATEAGYRDGSAIMVLRSTPPFEIAQGRWLSEDLVDPADPPFPWLLQIVLTIIVYVLFR